MSVVVVSFWMFTSKSVIERAVWDGSLERNATALGRATVPRLPHTETLEGDGERAGANEDLGKRGAGSVERSIPRSPIWRGIVKTRKNT